MVISFEQFQSIIWDYYKTHKRFFEWRVTNDPYKIVISEIMLQQTQTARVISKYAQFIEQFDSFNALASAQLQEILVVWQGLGYNRRAIFLQKLAQIIVRDFNGTLPACPKLLQTLPGVGWATSGSIGAFAFNMPTIFIETNIRAVFLHFFYPKQLDIQDRALLPLIEATVDQKNPREWYYALMDYGVMLKATVSNPSRNSAHYNKQGKFEGSDRQIRGMVLKMVVRHTTIDQETLFACIDRPRERIAKALQELLFEDFIAVSEGCIYIKPSNAV